VKRSKRSSACLAAAAGKSLPAKVDATIQVVTRRNVARARAKFQPVGAFESLFAALLRGCIRRLRIERSPGEGTPLTAELPLSDQSDD
jgi:hypothetical protein